jgi:hypothetical protein
MSEEKQDSVRDSCHDTSSLEQVSSREETPAGIKRALADSAAGRFKSLEEFDRDFRARHGSTKTHES